MVALLKWTIFCVTTCYGLISLLVYVSIVLVIRQHPSSFDTSFFRLFTYDAVMNIVLYVVNFFSMRLTQIADKHSALGDFYSRLDSDRFLNFCLGMRYHMCYVQYSIIALITVNRATVLFNQKTFEPLWQTICLPLVVVTFVVPFSVTHVIFDYTARFRWQESSEEYSLVSDLPSASLYTVLIPFVCLISIFSLSVNISIFFVIRSMTSATSSSTSSSSRANLNFVCIMIVTSVVQGVGAAMTVSLVRLQMSVSMYTVVRAALPYVSEALTLVQPWLLLGFSRPIQKKLKQLVGFQVKPRVPKANSSGRSVAWST